MRTAMIDSNEEQLFTMEMLILTVFSALVGLGCLGGVVWAMTSGEEVGVGRIFMVLVGLLFAALFLGMAGWIARQQLLKKPGAQAVSSSGDKPAKTGKAAS
jgi:hypothetical protein